MTPRPRRRLAVLSILLVSGVALLYLLAGSIFDRYAGELRARLDIRRGRPQYFVVTGVANVVPNDVLDLHARHGVQIVRTGCADLSPDQVAYNVTVADHFRERR
jgi:hypothetical protein